MKRMRWIALVLVLLSMVTLNVTAAVGADLLVQSDTPCTDRWSGCVAGGGGDDFCDGMWCGCMYSEYGYIC